MHNRIFKIAILSALVSLTACQKSDGGGKGDNNNQAAGTPMSPQNVAFNRSSCPQLRDGLYQHPSWTDVQDSYFNSPGNGYPGYNWSVRGEGLFYLDGTVRPYPNRQGVTYQGNCQDGALVMNMYQGQQQVGFRRITNVRGGANGALRFECEDGFNGNRVPQYGDMSYRTQNRPRYYQQPGYYQPLLNAPTYR